MLLGRIGPAVGFHGDGEAARAVHVSQADRFGGVATFGIPGSGKSTLVTNLFAYDLLDRVAPSGRAGHVGASMAQVVFESKGPAGVGAYHRWLGLFGAAAVTCEVADPASPAIDLFDVPGSAAERAAFFVDAMVYAFGESSIQYQSQNTLKIVLTAALLVSGQDLAGAGLPVDLSPLEVASVLLSGRGDQVGARLAAEFADRAARTVDQPAGEELGEAVGRLATLYGPGVSVSARRGLTAAPTSKVELLLSCRSWWSRRRVKVSLAQVLTRRWVLVLNTGAASGGQTVNEALTGHLCAMVTFLLRDSVARVCRGWREAGSVVSVYSDELGLLAGHGTGEALTWLRNQGREFGVWLTLGSQFPEQLPGELRRTVASLTTFVWFAQNDPGTIGSAVADLCADGSDWSSADVTNLPKFHAILRSTVDLKRHASVPLRMGFWGEHPDRFAADQGWPEHALAEPGWQAAGST